ncbi:anthranilate phosphoribosyltransferase [Salimicrobium jeotgali]|uniref:Anthranilate phosphoribosyltransferase n=2 Tax=Salimicrobium TaxID=351195 RepID=K2FNS6_9BACI|nr:MULTISPECIES: anthranilate phosphoribosyltransferase [Salimicrobium]AKG05104.1 anthranilate phosphoribosyltransferase [Salimicrobium jeotgali]EKE32531.1 anthranilate phosphoribosyltransferase [Salimicrobium jeotgali]MBM7695486.1 anthranilate phosphoribosyltransferase [Salimicrobium jeotgali]PBB04962.1 anthranilate phosphoribosyltransferase [Salimicrobium humidisoli]
MNKFLNDTLEGKVFSEHEAYELMHSIMNGEVTTAQLAGLLSLMKYRGETSSEITGFVKAMREHMKEFPMSDSDFVDTCGTGGDGASTYNISTAVSIILAGMGVKVAKHGNRKVSSTSGSADVIETLGIRVDSTPDEGAEALRAQGLTFLYAPVYHPAMKHAAKAREELGFRTVFNLLGPMSNPANAKRQLIGVYDTSYAEKMAEALKQLGSEHVLFVTGQDGLDEITITGTTDVVELKNNEITRFTVHPADFGYSTFPIEDVQIASSDESAGLIRNVLKGSAPEAAQAIAVMNAGAGVYVAGGAETIADGVTQVKEAIAGQKVEQFYEHLAGGKSSYAE